VGPQGPAGSLTHRAPTLPLLGILAHPGCRHLMLPPRLGQRGLSLLPQVYRRRTHMAPAPDAGASLR